MPTNENVLESEMCTYDIFVNSALGCPAECPLVPSADGQSKWLCSKHGVVSSDGGGSASADADRTPPC